MKKLTFILAAFVILLSAASCGKAHQCQCKVTYANGSVGTMNKNIRATKKKAQEECETLSDPSYELEDCTLID